MKFHYRTFHVRLPLFRRVVVDYRIAVALQQYRIRIGLYNCKLRQTKPKPGNQNAETYNPFSLPLSQKLLSKRLLISSCVIILGIYVNFSSNVITLANDVQKNPGPKSSLSNTISLQGLLLEGSELFSPLSRGKQCMCNSMTFILTVIQSLRCNIHISDWNSEMLTTILQAGDRMYQQIAGKSNYVIDYLLPADLPGTFALNFDYYSFEVLSTLSGGMSTAFKTNDSLFNLRYALTEMLQITPYGILVMHNTAVAIVRHDATFYVFDAHSRYLAGFCAPDGNSCLLAFKNLDHLTTSDRNRVAI